MPIDPVKVRLDSWISSRVSGISRARVQSSIRLGLVRVNDQLSPLFHYKCCDRCLTVVDFWKLNNFEKEKHGENCDYEDQYYEI